MTSTFGWVATDAVQRRNMLDAIDQFRLETTVDDLGLGVIRDTISDTLFPGTSTLHTRIRYVVFIPWLLQIAAATESDVAAMRSRFEASEYELIEALQRGGESQGVIGRVAGKTLQRTPSSVYWAMLSRWRVFEPGFTVQRFFEREILRRQQRQAPRADDPEAAVELVSTGLHEDLPPPPPNFLRAVDFTLVPEEAAFLREAILYNAPGSLLAHLAQHQPAGWSTPDTAPATFADPRILDGLPSAHLRDTVKLAERFAVALQGANLMYNHILARVTQRMGQEGSLEDYYAHEIDEWFVEARSIGIPTLDEQQELWHIVTATRTLAPSTRSFVADWCTTVARADSAQDILTSEATREKISSRERQKKGARARLKPGNRQALDTWSGAVGVQRFEYRWSYVVQHLQDLYDASELV